MLLSNFRAEIHGYLMPRGAQGEPTTPPGSRRKWLNTNELRDSRPAAADYAACKNL